jgi:RNA polymerase sigma-70 factor (ECF subfamily)
MSQPDARVVLSVAAARPPGVALRAWERAFATHYVGLCEYVLRFVGSAEAAEDLVQELFLRLWDTRGPRDASRLTRPYLYVAARNRALKYLRHARVADAWIHHAGGDTPASAVTPEDDCVAHELQDAAARAVAELPPRCRAVFVLRRRDHLGYQEIARRLGVSLGTVKSQMWRAAEQLRGKLAPFIP